MNSQKKYVALVLASALLVGVCGAAHAAIGPVDPEAAGEIPVLGAVLDGAPAHDVFVKSLSTHAELFGVPTVDGSQLNFRPAHPVDELRRLPDTLPSSHKLHSKKPMLDESTIRGARVAPSTGKARWKLARKNSFTTAQFAFSRWLKFACLLPLSAARAAINAKPPLSHRRAA